MYVRISKTLTDEVEARIKAMAHDEERRISESVASPTSEEEEAITDCTLRASWRNFYSQRDQFPREWKCKPNNVVLKVRPPEEWGQEVLDDDGQPLINPSTMAGTVEMEVHLKGQMLSPGASSYYHTEHAGYEACNDVLKAYVRRRWDAAIKIRKSKKAFAAMRDQIVGYLQSQTSLNTALKEVPELALYVEQKYIDKVNEPAKKRTKATQTDDDTETLSIDVEAIAAAAIAHRIHSAGG